MEIRASTDLIQCWNTVRALSSHLHLNYSIASVTSICWSSSQSQNTCRRPEELPPTKAFLVGWNAVTGSTVFKFSSSMKVCCSQPFSWNTCTLRGFNMLPAAKQPSCFGSHTADIFVTHRPVCMFCLEKKKGDRV